MEGVSQGSVVAKVHTEHLPRAPPPPPPLHDSSLALATRPPRQAVSYLTCSKLCAICFVAGVVFGYTLRGRVRRWASKLLRKLT